MSRVGYGSGNPPFFYSPILSTNSISADFVRGQKGPPVPQDVLLIGGGAGLRNDEGLDDFPPHQIGFAVDPRLPHGGMHFQDDFDLAG